MFKPTRVSRLNIQVPEEYISQVTSILAKMHLLHLIHIKETPLKKFEYEEKTQEMLLKYQGLMQILKEIISGLNIEEKVPPVDIEIIPERQLFELRENINSIQKKTYPVIEKLEENEEKLEEKTKCIEKLNLLLPSEIDFNRLSNLYFLHWTIGLLPTDNIEKLELSLEDTFHTIVQVSQIKDRTLVFAFCLKENKSVLERALKSAFLEKLDISEDLKGRVEDNLNQAIEEKKKLETEKNELLKYQAELRQTYEEKVLFMKEKILMAEIILKARSFFGKIEKTYFISGWIPKKLFEELKKRILEVTKGKAIVELVEPELEKEVRSGILKVPILFNNPYLIRPFEKLTTFYGVPRYKEIEPTPFLALSFLLMFGFMFGDVGHGAVLFIIGYYVFRRLYKYIDYGIILMECGIFSAFFGLLYGSVFGYSNIVPTLWFEPMKNIPTFIKTALIFGIGVISLGLILNIINALKLKRYEELLSHGGLIGAMFYWILAGIAIRYVVSGKLTILPWLVFAIIVLILLMTFKKPLINLIFRKKRRKIVSKGLSVSLFESFIEVIDGIISYVANTVSFIRIAAFALTHAGLFIAVFSLAETMSRFRGGGFLYWLIIVLGNIVIIGLEGLVVSIQALRLEYYEFFSKFFKGGGEPFKPLEVKL
ncbi:MAG: V-type ATPase 116kDa subunit family protein [Acidobacteriota bacterium]|nr:V-type ATPase 116kDa subunit family protein [Acidobacteriota bacterium]